MTLASAHQIRAPGPIIDIGCNLADKQFTHDVDVVLERASQANVSHIVLTGTSLPSTRNAIKLIQARQAAEKEKNQPDQQRLQAAVDLTCTAGIHPHSAKDILRFKDWKQQIRQLVEEHPTLIRAIGECGLDYNRMFSPREIQRRCFEEHLELARELELPVFLHYRDAFEDFVEHLERFPEVKKCVHCHTDPDPAHLTALLALPGTSIGITGWVADDRRGQGLAALVPEIPMERLMLETDAPYLTPRTTPRPLARRNEPALLPWVLKRVAECYGGKGTTVRGREQEIIAARTTENAKAFFGLK